MIFLQLHPGHRLPWPPAFGSPSCTENSPNSTSVWYSRLLVIRPQLFSLFSHFCPPTLCPNSHCFIFDPQTFLMFSTFFFFFFLLFFNTLCSYLMLSICQNSITFTAPSCVPDLSPDPQPEGTSTRRTWVLCGRRALLGRHALPVLWFFCRLTSSMKSQRPRGQDLSYSL